MASTPEYLEYVLDLLAGVPEVSSRKMMREYLLYASGRLFGGVYDDRFLVKDTGASRAVPSRRRHSPCHRSLAGVLRYLSLSLTAMVLR